MSLLQIRPPSSTESAATRRRWAIIDPMSRLFLVRSALDRRLFDRLDASADVIGCTFEALRRADRDLVDRLAERRSMLIVAGGGTWVGLALAAGLLADWFAPGERARLILDDANELDAVAAALVWRIQRRALGLLLEAGGSLTAAESMRRGLADSLVPERADPLEWIESWIGPRSLSALHAAAVMIRSRRGDVAERAEFARLFATGEPRKGLEAFLKKERADFSRERIVEIL